MSFTEDELQAFHAILTRCLAEHRQEVEQVLDQRLTAFQQEMEQRVDYMLAAQLLGIQQLLSQHAERSQEEVGALLQNLPQHFFAGVELQAELSWDDMMQSVDKVLDARFVALNTSLHHSLKNLEQYLAVRLHDVRDEITRNSLERQSPANQLRSQSFVQNALSQENE